MNPLLLIGLAVGGIYLLTRKPEYTAKETARNTEREQYIASSGSPNLQKAYADVLAIHNSNLSRDEQNRLIKEYLDKALASGAITRAEYRQIMN